MKKNITVFFNRILKDIRAYGLLVVIYLIYHIVTQHVFRASCPLILLTGYPCPGCGMTRAIYLTLTFQFEKAFYLNPTAFLWVAFFIYLFITRYIMGKSYKITWWLVSVVVMLTIVRYIYGMLVFYPDRIPYVHTNNNITHYLLSVFE